MGFLDFMKDYGQNLFSGEYRDRHSSSQLGGGTGQSSTKPVVGDLTYKTTSTGEQLPESTTGQEAARQKNYTHLLSIGGKKYGKLHGNWFPGSQQEGSSKLGGQSPNRREVKDDWDLRAIQAEEAWNNREDDPEKAKKFNLMMANRLAKTFDPQSKEGVQAIQTYMQRAGIKDYEGKEIEADAMFGKRTESGLRQIQDMYERQNMGMSDYGFKNTPPPSQFSQGSSPPTDPSFSLSMPEASQGQPDDIFDVVDLRK